MDLNKTNEYGVPLHACNGYRQDEHWWTWIGYKHSLEPHCRISGCRHHAKKAGGTL